MKRFLWVSLAALGLAVVGQQKAWAWKNFSFTTGMNIRCSKGNNSFCGFKNGPYGNPGGGNIWGGGPGGNIWGPNGGNIWGPNSGSPFGAGMGGFGAGMGGFGPGMGAGMGGFGAGMGGLGMDMGGFDGGDMVGYGGNEGNFNGAMAYAAPQPITSDSFRLQPVPTSTVQRAFYQPTGYPLNTATNNVYPAYGYNAYPAYDYYSYPVYGFGN